MTEFASWAAASALTGGAVGVGSWFGTPWLDRLNARALARLRPQVESVGGDVARLPEFLRWWRAAIVAIGLVFWFGFRMPPVAVFMMFVVHQGGPLVVEWWVASRRKKITEQAATAARGLAAQVRVGVTLGEGLVAVARDTAEPFGGILRRATAQLEQGQDVREVLGDLKRKVKLDAVALMSAALLVAAEKGGKLADVLNRISASLDELQRVTRKRDVDTAAGRFMVLIMSFFPAAFVVMLCGMDSTLAHTLFDFLPGQIVLTVVGLLVWASVRWAGRILAKVE